MAAPNKKKTDDIYADGRRQGRRHRFDGVSPPFVPGPPGPHLCRRPNYAYGHRRHRSIYADGLTMPTAAVGIDKAVGI